MEPLSLCQKFFNSLVAIYGKDYADDVGFLLEREYSQRTTKKLETENDHSILSIFLIERKEINALMHSMLNGLIRIIDSIFSGIFLEKISYPLKTFQKISITSPTPTRPCNYSYKSLTPYFNFKRASINSNCNLEISLSISWTNTPYGVCEPVCPTTLVKNVSYSDMLNNAIVSEIQIIECSKHFLSI